MPKHAAITNAAQSGKRKPCTEIVVCYASNAGVIFPLPETHEEATGNSNINHRYN